MVLKAHVFYESKCFDKLSYCFTENLTDGKIKHYKNGDQYGIHNKE